MMTENVLHDLYYSLKSPGSFTGIDALYLTAKKQLPNLTRKRVKEFLEKQQVYLIHRRVRKPKGKAHKFAKYVLTAPHLDLACDTALFGHSKLAQLLVCRDPFSGYVYAKQQRGLKSETTLNNFKKLIEEQAGGKHFPVIYTDKGREFARFNSLPGKHVTTHGRNQKSFPAEQTIKQIRAKLQRYYSFVGRKSDLAKVLPDILTSINETPSTKTGLTPKEGLSMKNAGLIFDKKYGSYLKEKERSQSKAKFKVGDLVKVSLPKTGDNTFAKKSLPGFSAESFHIVSVRGTLPQSYYVEDSVGRRVDCYFYENELLKSWP